MSHVLSRPSTTRLGAVALAGGLLLAGLAGCGSSTSKNTGAAGAPTSPASTFPAASNCPALGAAPAAAVAGSGSVTVYSADGLYDASDDKNWYNQEFKAFTAATGIKVNYVEGGSGAMETRVETEKSNTQADVLVTLPPFIQKAEATGVLAPYTPACADKIDPSQVDKNGQWESIMGDYLSFIYNAPTVGANPPKTWQDLLDPKYKGKLQYSTPGVAGDGTAVMIKAIHDFGSADAAMAYFKQLQTNNVGPSSSTGKLEGKVNTGELLVANGDVQMNYVDGKNSNPNNKIFFVAGSDGVPNTFALPYMAGLVKNAPNADNGKKLIDFLLSEKAQLDASAVAYGFPARTDIKPTDANYTALQTLMQGVTVFPVDWNDVASHYADYISAWNKATGSGS